MDSHLLHANNETWNETEREGIRETKEKEERSSKKIHEEREKQMGKKDGWLKRTEMKGDRKIVQKNKIRYFHHGSAFWLTLFIEVYTQR